jgi:hypothetical protein
MTKMIMDLKKLLKNIESGQRGIFEMDFRKREIVNIEIR